MWHASLKVRKILSLVIIVIMSITPLSLSLDVNIMVLYTSIGTEANRTDIRDLAPVWERYINNKTTFDSTWPFNITVETFETASDCERITTIMETRFNDLTLPNITAIVAEGDNCGSGKETLHANASLCMHVFLKM
jgi:hypothetical protein